MEDQLPYLGPRSLSSMAMERILLLDISTPSSSIPATLLEDIIILRTCEGTYRMSSSSARQHNLTTQTTQPLPLPHIISSRNISVTKPDPGTWQIEGLFDEEGIITLALGRYTGNDQKYVCWIDGSSIKIAVILDEDTDDDSEDSEDTNDDTDILELKLELRFKIETLELKIFFKTANKIDVVENMYVKM